MRNTFNLKNVTCIHCAINTPQEQTFFFTTQEKEEANRKELFVTLKEARIFILGQERMASTGQVIRCKGNTQTAITNHVSFSTFGFWALLKIWKRA